jgi:Na+/H+ antiporter NhaD/arsenite permease-like protein
MTFFLSAILDNLTTSIVMIMVLRKLVQNREERLIYAGLIVISANSGGAFSPIGDVTTIMLWIKGQVTTFNIIVKTLLPSLVCLVVPVLILSAHLKGEIVRPEQEHDGIEVAPWMRKLVLIMGVCGLIFVPVFKTITHLPPYLGMLLSLSVLWVTTEILSRRHSKEGHELPTAVSTLEHVDVPTILFFLGILMAVSCLKVAGILGNLAQGLDGMRSISVGGETVGFFLIDLIIGVLSSIVDNVPLVAAVQGMYPMGPEGFIANHPFWEFLAYCAGTGGSLLIIGSAAGVAVMGMEKIDFIWYLKKISWLALAGYLAGAVVFVAMNLTFERYDWWSQMVEMKDFESSRLRVLETFETSGLQDFKTSRQQGYLGITTTRCHDTKKRIR